MKYLVIIFAFLIAVTPATAQNSQKTEMQQKIDTQFENAQKLFAQDKCKEALRCLTDSVNIKLGVPNSEFNEQQKELHDAIQLCLKIQYQISVITETYRAIRFLMELGCYQAAAHEWYQGKQFMDERNLNMPDKWYAIKKEIDAQINLRRLKKTV